MAFLRPNADDVDGAWTTDLGATTLFSAIDEASASDSDYIRSPIDPVDAACRVALENPVGTPAEPAVMRYRFQNTGGVELRVRLVQGASTEIAVWNHADQDAWTDAAQTLTSPQFAAITDWTDLFIEFKANVGGGSDLLLRDRFDAQILQRDGGSINLRA